MKLKVDAIRWMNQEKYETGIYVRALIPGDIIYTVDVGVLNKESLLEYLRMNGGSNPIAENIIGILLGHGHLHKESEE